MSKAVRKSKLDALLRDFDVEVESRITRMEKDEKWACKSIQKAVTMLLIKMPQNIKKMTVAEFHANGGTFNKQALKDLSEEVESLAQGICNSTERKTNSEDKTEVSSEVSMSQSESEDRETEAAPTTKTTTKKGKGRQKKTATVPAAPKTSRQRTAKSADPDSADENTNPVAPPTRRSARASTRSRRGTTTKNQFETPAANKGKAGLMQAGLNLNTPMVTPKFDPRLPVTPACLREAKRGETIMSMSGSPISNPTKLDCNLPGILTLGNGKVLDVNTSDDSTIEDLAMDETTRKNIQMLQGHLARLLQHPQKT